MHTTILYHLLNLADIYILYNGQLTTDIARLYELSGFFQPGTLNAEPLNL